MKAFRAGLFGALGVVVAIVLLVVVGSAIAGGGKKASVNPTGSTPTASGSWRVVTHFTIQGQRNTEPFTVAPRWRFSWKNCGPDPSLTTYYAEGPDAGYNIGSAGGGPEGTENLYNKPGRYYLHVLVFDNPCDITVEDYR